jgi:hypothetical protein
MKGYRVIIALLVLWTASASADEKTQGVATKGTGTFSCAKFTRYDTATSNSEQMNLIVEWTWGFMSAYNLRAAFSEKFQQSEAPNPIALPEAPAVLSFIREFCQKNPQSNVANATLGLIGRSGGGVSSSVVLP